MISKKKLIYEISPVLREYLQTYGRSIPLPLKYKDLSRYSNAIPLYDKKGEDTLWETVFYDQQEMDVIYEALKEIYALLKADGDLSVMQHLYIDRVDLCVYGNTQPFRVRIVNKINDNFDYFYVKQADASRVYGLELEHLLSPNLLNFLVDQNTLIEEHIAGIPGDLFMNDYLHTPNLNKIRLAKEFIKFNERCFVRLLGDMHSSNFVVDITPDFEEVHYRIRAIDFDQQSYEGRRSVYLPQYFKQNNPLIQIGMENITPETMKQYQKEERALIAARIRSSFTKLQDMIGAMCQDELSKTTNVTRLREEMTSYYKNKAFLQCKNMGEILQLSLSIVMD